ncbi:MAG TPA: DUF2851 family protein [Puia sp.]|nr:DUF2851 family protein [Puia sp.]
MTEKLFQFIWQFRYFNQTDLRLENGESVQVVLPGQLNQNQGPDFLNAKIKIGSTLWVGHVELHLHSSDWEKHAHTQDKNYRNVILHVVMENDARIEGNEMATLVLHNRVSKILLEKYTEWMRDRSFIPCEKNILQVPGLVWTSWKQRILVERLQRKSVIIRQYLLESHSHWEEIFWWMMAANFGAKVNSGSFEAIARTLSTAILARHKNQVHQLEAMLLGQAGILEENFREAYPSMLKKEYEFLRSKYQLKPVYQSVQFLRMRPGNFPTIRLSQLADLVHRSSHLFSRIKEIRTINEMKALLEVRANDYWHYHYTFEESSPFRMKALGRQMIENIMINTIAPVLYTYGCLHQEEVYSRRAIQWLQETPAETNALMKKWTTLGLRPENAGDSQAKLELKSQYCDKKRCLECAVGNALLKRMAS